MIAIDGKTIRGSKSESHKAYHVVSTFAVEDQLVLGELVTEENSNEITAVPELLDSLNIENSIVTADAMSCQKEIVKTIREGGADYVIGLKGNQSAIWEDVSFYFEHFAGKFLCFVTRMKDYGRIEKREYLLLTDLSWLPRRQDREELQAAPQQSPETEKPARTRAFSHSYWQIRKHDIVVGLVINGRLFGRSFPFHLI